MAKQSGKLYEDNIKPYLKEIREWRELGWKVEDIAFRLEVSRETLNRSRKKFPELEECFRKAHLGVNHKIKDTLVMKALGYCKKRTTKKVRKELPDGKIVVEETEYEEDLAPDTTLLIFLACNRMPEEFKRNGPEDATEATKEAIENSNFFATLLRKSLTEQKPKDNKED